MSAVASTSRSASPMSTLRSVAGVSSGLDSLSAGPSYSRMSSGGQQTGDQQTLFRTMSGDISSISFQRLETSCASWIQLIFSMILTMTGFIFAYHGCYSGDECSGYYLMLYLRAFFWVATYMIHLYVKSKHNRLKLLGYHKFLRITYRQKKASLQLVSLSNLLILTIHTAIMESFGTDFLNSCYVKGISMNLLLSIWCLVECMILIYIHITYFVKVRVFNTMQSPPDALDTPALRNGYPNGIAPAAFINQQFTMITKMMEGNRRLKDKIREVRSAAHLINSESTHISMAEQSVGGY